MIGDFVWSGLRKKIKDLGWWFFLSCCGLVVVDVCAMLVFFFFFFFLFSMDVSIIILMSYLYYFNQIAKNIDQFDIGCEEVK